MLEVLPIQTKAEQELICRRCEAEYREELLAYGAYVEGELCGVCQFKLTHEGGVIYSLDSMPGHEEFQPMFVMGRATMSFMELCGAETAYYEAEVKDEVLVHAIGFRRDENGRLSVDLRGFFDHPCRHDSK